MSTTANNVQNGKPGAGLSEKDKDAEKSGTTLARRATVGPVRSLSRPSIVSLILLSTPLTLFAW